MSKNMIYATQDPQAEANSNGGSEEEYTFYTPFKFDADPRGLGNYLFNKMKKYRHCIAQYIADTDEEDTYGELLLRCIRTASHLSTRNLTKDDVVVLCSYNQKESLVPFISSIFLNVPVAPMDPRLSLMESVYLLKEVKPKIIFVDHEGLKLMETSVKQAELDTEIIVYCSSDTYTEFSSFLEPHLIMTHPSVDQVVIIGIPHGVHGDHPMAVIVPKESSTAPIDEEDIIKFVEERVEEKVSHIMRLTAGVKFVTSIPMTPSGKIRRREVKKMVLDGDL
uniref:Uncharacterized protein LOC114340929 n=1 Tax=Diabrotica virgifera virgifera TaxID=50390 RepID=A0A6P7GQJ5_DIAVI